MTEYSPINDESPSEAEFGCCGCWNFSAPRRRFERISPSTETEQSSGDRRWWERGVDALKKAREWSELVAGPKWKTFIRRFNRVPRRSRTTKFRYDPLSYALNFDEGQGKNGQDEEERDFRDFSTRFTVIRGERELMEGRVSDT